MDHFVLLAIPFFVLAAVLALSLATVTIYVGTRINPDEAFDVKTPMIRLIGGAFVALLMVAMK